MDNDSKIGKTPSDQIKQSCCADEAELHLGFMSADVALQISFTQKQQKLLPTFWKIVIAVINA